MLKNTCYTIGHSNLPFEKFLELLKTFDIDCVVDARSIPYSKYAKQFNKKSINSELSNHNIYDFISKSRLQ